VAQRVATTVVAPMEVEAGAIQVAAAEAAAWVARGEASSATVPLEAGSLVVDCPGATLVGSLVADCPGANLVEVPSAAAVKHASVRTRA